mgnify:CR=1 FL=1
MDCMPEINLVNEILWLPILSLISYPPSPPPPRCFKTTSSVRSVSKNIEKLLTASTSCVRLNFKFIPPHLSCKK